MRPEITKKQITELWNTACESICNGDWESYSQCWSHSSNIQLLHPDQGEWLTGWNEIGNKYKIMLTTGTTCRISRNDLKLHLSPTAGMAWGTVDIQLHFSDSAETSLHLWETVIFEQIDGQWKIVHGMAAIPKDLKEKD